MINKSWKGVFKYKFNNIINLKYINNIKYIVLISVFVSIIFVTSNSNIYAMSDNFKFIIDTIGIPEYNVSGQYINEEVYYTYNVFAYCSPTNLLDVKEQRFKSVPYSGKWTKEGGKYNGYGTQGEYNIIGTSYAGGLIYNPFFPVDRSS